MIEIPKIVKSWLIVLSIPIIINVIGCLFFHSCDMIFNDSFELECSAWYGFAIAMYTIFLFGTNFVFGCMIAITFFGYIYRVYIEPTYIIDKIMVVYTDAFQYINDKYTWIYTGKIEDNGKEQ